MLYISGSRRSARGLPGGRETQRGGPWDAFQKTNLKKALKVILWQLSCCSLVLYWCSCRPSKAFAWLWQSYMPPPGSVGVLSTWHCYFGGRGLKILGIPALYKHLSHNKQAQMSWRGIVSPFTDQNKNCCCFHFAHAMSWPKCSELHKLQRTAFKQRQTSAETLFWYSLINPKHIKTHNTITVTTALSRR